MGVSDGSAQGQRHASGHPGERLNPERQASPHVRPTPRHRQQPPRCQPRPARARHSPVFTFAYENACQAENSPERAYRAIYAIRNHGCALNVRYSQRAAPRDHGSARPIPATHASRYGARLPATRVVLLFRIDYDIVIKIYDIVNFQKVCFSPNFAN